MGFMDKAKKMAEQAQEKLDEVQTQFNEKQSGQGQQGGGSVTYDKHGRPVESTPDPTAGSPAPGSPASPAPPAAEQAPAEAPAGEAAEEADQPAPDEPASEPVPPPSGGANATPDPFKPIE